MVAMAPPEGLENEYALQWNGPWEQAWVLPATVAEQDNFEAILRMIDWLYSDEAMVAMTFGEEGTTYKVEDGKEKDFWMIRSIINRTMVFTKIISV